eukprot:362866-Chlamydomonas_euryale.AAC.12
MAAIMSAGAPARTRRLQVKAAVAEAAAELWGWPAPRRVAAMPDTRPPRAARCPKRSLDGCQSCCTLPAGQSARSARLA